MKKKIIKLWGIGMIVVLMASLLVVGATPAAAAPLAWTPQAIPAGVGFTWQIAGGSDVSFVRVAPNGDIFAVDTQTGNLVYKSTTGGLTWGPPAAILVGGVAVFNIVDIVISPSYATDGTVVVLANTLAAGPAQAYISTNAGLTYAVLGAAIPGLGTSVAISPNYVYPVGEIMVGTTDAAGAAATYGDVYIWGRGGVLTWVATAIAADVTEVAYSPNNPIDATRLAIGSNAAGTALYTLVAADAGWGLTLGPALINALALDTGSAGAIVASDLALPSDFNAMSPFGRTCYVSTISGTNDNIARVVAGAGIAAAPVLLNPYGAFGGAPPVEEPIVSLAHSGTYAAGTLYAGDTLSTLVFKTVNPSAPPGFTAWTFSLVPPTPNTIPATAAPTYVALAADYATSNKVYAGTAGGFAETALSVSNDGGVYFKQAGLIDTAIAGINDIQAASTSELYLSTNDGGAGPESVWQTLDGGLTWYRVLTMITTANNGIIRLSNAYATDNTVIFGDVTGVAFMVSMDGGSTWVPRTTAPAGVTIGDIAVKDAYTYYIGNNAAATVQATINGGWTWQVAGTALGAGAAVNDIEVDTATGHILAATNVGTVHLSTNNNLTYGFGALGFAAITGGGAAICEFDVNYATNNCVYGADTATAIGVDLIWGTADDVGVTGISRFVVGTDVAWNLIDFGNTWMPRDIVSAPDGVLYVSDAAGATAATGGVSRALDPANPLSFLVTAERVSTADGLVAGSVLTLLAVTGGSNVIYAVNGVAVVTYTDILAQAIPAVISPAEGDIVLAGAAAVSIAPVAGNPFGAYQVQWNTRPDYLGVGNTLAFPPVINAINLNTVGIPVPAGATIYFRVQTTATLFGPWSDTMTFETQLTAGAINAPAILSPIANGTGPGGYGAALNPTFNWGVIGGATNYGFELASDASFDDPILSLTGDDALGNILVYKLTTMTLEYGTTYYWRVMGISATSETAWSAAVGFTTMDEPVVEPQPTFTQPADIVITIPPASSVPDITLLPAPIEDTAQGYIWAIIIIGAVLVIAVIVLIVRTRRSV